MAEYRREPVIRSRTKQLYGIFQEMFPSIAEKIRIYGPFDKDSLKVETTDKKFYVFNYNNDRDWGLQTYKNYIECRRIFPKVDSRV